MILFTSDSHFYHDKILEYCPERPGKTVEEMTEKLIANWCEAVDAGDSVFHIGDFALSEGKKRIPELLSRLKGHLTIIRGNHDQGAKLLYEAGFKVVLEEGKIRTNGKNIWLRHYPPESDGWPQKYESDIFICGHVHQSWSKRTVELKGKTYYTINVGVDAQGFYPRTLDELLARAPIPEKPREDQCRVCGASKHPKADGSREPCHIHPEG
jgi:calcineurin-like phosphoesterase family protein